MIENITMIRGDTYVFDVDITGLTDTITSAYFTCRTNFGGTQLFQKTLNNGIEVTSGTIKKVRITIDSTDTSALSYGTFVYDLKIGTSSATVTILNGIFNIEPDVKNTGSSGNMEEAIYGELRTDVWG